MPLPIRCSSQHWIPGPPRKRVFLWPSCGTSQLSALNHDWFRQPQTCRTTRPRPVAGALLSGRDRQVRTLPGWFELARLWLHTNPQAERVPDPNFDQLPSDRRASVASESPRLVMSVLADLKSDLPGMMSPWRAPQTGSGMFGLGLGGRYTPEDVTRRDRLVFLASAKTQCPSS